MSVKTPTSSLSAVGLLVNVLWYRGEAKVKSLLYGTPDPETPTAYPCLIAKLPHELVNLIVSHLIHDKRTLLACSLTCYSWYIVTVHHLHHTLTTDNDFFHDKKLYWPKPLRRSYDLGLLPLVRQLRIRSRDYPAFTSRQLGRFTLPYFSALTNLQELGIDNLQVSGFIPNIQQYFGHLLPTLRFLALQNPQGSSRQILYFIGFFPNLQDLKLQYTVPKDEQESTDDATLVPLSNPPLRGRLTLTCFTRESLVNEMILHFGGLRFRQMELFGVKCVQLLLKACAGTLETLRLYPTDADPKDHAKFQHFDLSQNKALRTLETTAESITRANLGEEQDIASDFFKSVLSSVTSFGSLDIVIIYKDSDICGLQDRDSEPVCLHHSSQEIWDKTLPRHQKNLGVLHEMYKTRDFRLVLCADVSDSMMEHAVDILARVAEAGKAMAEIGHLHEPLVISEKRTLSIRPRDVDAGYSRRYVSASAL